MIDEADNAASKLNLGAFLKNLTENLIKEGNSRILIILAGMRPLINILRESHESSLRLFEQFELNPLSPDEVKRIIQNGLEESNSYSAGDRITINGDALDQIVYYSDCYPPFVQQIGYSVFSANTDSLITVEDVENGMYMSGGSLDIIGDKFYSYPYYNRISADSYRQILGIMANKKGTDWLSKKEIGNEFKGKKTELTNGIKALRERDMILSRPGVRGQYRLPWVTFSLWIKKVQNI